MGTCSFMSFAILPEIHCVGLICIFTYTVWGLINSGRFSASFTKDRVLVVGFAGRKLIEPG